MTCIRLNARKMSENPKQEIAVAEAIFQIENPEAFAEYRRRIDTRDPRGVAVIIVDDEATGREELKKTLAMTKF